MALWIDTLPLKDIWVDDKDFKTLRDEVVKRIREQKFYNFNDYELVSTVEQLEKTRDYEEFNYWWDTFYDWCDSHRVWVRTR